MFTHCSNIRPKYYQTFHINLTIFPGLPFRECWTGTLNVLQMEPLYIVELVDEIRLVKLDLEGRGDPMRVFDSNGDGNIGYRIYNVQKDPDSPQTLIYNEVSFCNKS